ncbi:hypothetical protein ROHU_022689 [Labeo rohita]|uniref:Uncharacterized protein n=1 Tax=Labeo rohita TaxID=84645 RepID=A0A498MT08_LABRO|nr:hypothetical protein ROHU_022689 [Labeo rohita]
MFAADHRGAHGQRRAERVPSGRRVRRDCALELEQHRRGTERGVTSPARTESRRTSRAFKTLSNIRLVSAIITERIAPAHSEGVLLKLARLAASKNNLCSPPLRDTRTQSENNRLSVGAARWEDVLSALTCAAARSRTRRVSAVDKR